MSRKKVLLVDDDVDLLESLKQRMGRFAGESWEIMTAAEVSQAMVLLQQRRVDLLVVDIRMPLVDGVQFLGLLQRTFPNLLKVVLTAEATDEHRSACLNSGAELFLEKPRDEGGWRAVFAMLNELTKFQPDQGFSGVLRRVGLQDVLQMECLSRHSVVLEIRAGDQRGAIYVKDGQIVHAELDSQVGEAGFTQLMAMAMAGGEFELRPWTAPSQTTVSGSWEFLLMEAARARDEKAAVEPSPGTDTPFLQREGARPDPTTGTVVPVLGVAETGEVAGLDEAGRAGAAGRAEPGRSQVEEVLICSLQGEVLHDWQCPNTTGRVGVLEFISQKARQMAQRLPLGAFDRLEVNGSGFRVIAQIQPDRALFLRTRSAGRPGRLHP